MNLRDKVVIPDSEVTYRELLGGEILKALVSNPDVDIPPDRAAVLAVEYTDALIKRLGVKAIKHKGTTNNKLTSPEETKS